MAADFSLNPQSIELISDSEIYDGFITTPIPPPPTCLLNSSVRGRVSNLRTRFWTTPIVNLKVSYVKSLCYFSQIFPLFIKEVRIEDTFELTIGGVQNLVLKLETRPRIELFRSRIQDPGFPGLKTRT